MYIPFDLSLRPHVILFSRLDGVNFFSPFFFCFFFFAAVAGGRFRAPLDAAAATRSTSVEFAEGAERRMREGVAAVIGP